MKIKGEKNLLLLALFVALVSCGGGGGGGGSYTPPPTTSTTPTTPTTPTAPTTPTTPTTPAWESKYDSNGNIKWNDKTRTYDKTNPNNQTVSSTINGAGVTVGVLDMGFGTTDPDLITEMNNRFGSSPTGRLERKTNFGVATPHENHGIVVAGVVGGNSIGIAKKVNIIGVDVSKLQDGEYHPDPSLAAYEYLRNRGVKIYNQSFGVNSQVTDYEGMRARMNNKDYEYQINNGGTENILGFYKTEVNNGALFIWAGGNDFMQDNPTLEAGLPHLVPELEKGWINVVGLAAKPIHDAGSTEWSELQRLNGAGVAKNWTVTAVSGISTTTKAKNKSTNAYEIGNWQMNGSSYAAPMVAGTAALIKQKYPWMTGDLIRQTILSTATDIGKKGVDEDFGWGLLNVDKALKGPALFDKRLALGNDVVANVTAGTYVFSNDISGDAGFIKNGPGTIRFDGKLSYTGGTVINDGKLIIRGTTYNTGATRITFGNMVVAENVKIGNSVKNENGKFEVEGNNVTIEGNYTADKNATTVLNSDANVHVTGKVELNGSKLELKSEKDGVAQYVTAKGTEAKITSDNKVEGNVANVETSEMLKGDVETSENAINATLSRKNVEEYISELPEADAMRKDVAENLEASFKKLDEEVEKGNGAVKKFAMDAAQLQTMSLPTRAAILDSLSGQIYASAQALTFQHSQTVNKDLSNRLVMLGTLENVGDNAGLWVTGIGANGKLKQEGFGEGKTRVTGGQVGVDRKFGENLILGAALSYSTSKVNFDRHGGKSNADNFGISLYGRLGNKEVPYYVQGRLGAGFVDSKVERDIILGTSNVSRAKINHNDTVYSGYVETGYDVKKGNFTLTPYVGLSHDTVSRGGFTEENSQFGLTADKKTYSQTAGLVGVRVGQGVNWSNGSKSTFQGYVTHQLGFKEQDLSFEAAYTGLSNAKFTVKGIGLSKNQTWIGAGVLTEVNPRFAWYINYDGKLEKKGRNNVFTTGLRFNF